MLHKCSSISLANTAISQLEYEDVISQWLSSPPLGSVRARLGMKLVRNYRQVTPHMLESARGLVKALLSMGLTSGVLQATRFEGALAKVLGRNPVLAAGEPDSGKFVLEIGIHMRCLFCNAQALEA